MSLLAIKENLLISYKPKNIINVYNDDLIFDKNFYVTPFDYGAIAIIYDPQKINSKLQNFLDLTNEKSSLIIQHPRSSSTGQAFLLWTIAAFGDNWEDFWRQLKPSIYTVSSGWSESFSRFSKGEVPMIVSYATDGAYSYEYYSSTKNKTFIPEEGAYVQIEGVGIVNGTKNLELAQKFIEFVLTEDFQKEIPLNQWMFPVIKVELPDSFEYAVIPDKFLILSADVIDKNIEDWLIKWEKIIY